jgi:hypothetical protein
MVLAAVEVWVEKFMLPSAQLLARLSCGVG